MPSNDPVAKALAAMMGTQPPPVPGQSNQEVKETTMKGLTVSLKPEHADAKLGVSLKTEDMTYGDLIKVAYQMATDRETIIEFDRHITGEPLDVARSMNKAIRQIYGWTESKGGFFVPPFINFQTAYGVTEEVPWGNIIIPGLDASINTCGGHPDDNGDSRLTLHVSVRKKDVSKIDEIVALTKQIFGNSSVYRGKAIELSFNPTEVVKHGAPPVRTPRFMEPPTVLDEDIVFSKHITDQLDVLVHTPILAMPELAQDGIPTKQTVLLGGEHGTGKTLELARLQRMAVDNGVTYILVHSADHIVPAIEWARKVEPAVLVCEDIDAVVKGERNLQMNVLLEAIDGIKSKGRKLLMVLTTNFPEKIHPGFVRTGRVDAYIYVSPPDGPAVERLIRNYGRGLIADEDLTQVGLALQGHKPSTIRGAVERAKLARLNRWIKAGKPEEKGLITASDLLDAVNTMQPHFKLMARENQQPIAFTLDDYQREMIVQELDRALDKRNGGDLDPVIRDARVPRMLPANGGTSNGNGHSDHA